VNETTVPSYEVEALLSQVAAAIDDMSPQLRKGAAFVLDHPEEVGLASVRELAAAAGVKPNTLMRMAQAIGFSGFEDFRQPFRNQLRRDSFGDRAGWLQEVARSGRLGSVYADMAGTALENVEKMFAGVEAEELKSVADRIVAARRTYIVGVGANFPLAQSFAHLVGMALDTVMAVPRHGNVPMDTVVRAGERDVVIAMTFAPYRSEVVEATEVARNQGATVVAITDSHGSPIALRADHVFLTPSAGPQFFPSTLAAAALLETLASFIVADAPGDVVEAIDRFHQRRYDFGVYWRDGS
jgi:DNA-binding MurR/RpiR family transcriptional regulator